LDGLHSCAGNIWNSERAGACRRQFQDSGEVHKTFKLGFVFFLGDSVEIYG